MTKKKVTRYIVIASKRNNEPWRIHPRPKKPKAKETK